MRPGFKAFDNPPTGRVVTSCWGHFPRPGGGGVNGIRFSFEKSCFIIEYVHVLHVCTGIKTYARQKENPCRSSGFTPKHTAVVERFDVGSFISGMIVAMLTV